MSAQAIRLPLFPIPALGEDEAPRVMTDSAAERAWVPAYGAMPTYASAEQLVPMTLATAV
ncbi:hypothetical protein [Streptomyces sp. NPDC023838]|uniref:hypothetical protein n=1 Tax=Streptomyces sp. NPDC023838 TaxID=3154325 RepID=UPI0033FDDF0B